MRKLLPYHTACRGIREDEFADLIPDSIFEFFFGRCVKESDREVMSLELNTIMDEGYANKYSEFPDDQKLKTWLCILFKNSNAENKVLVEIAKIMSKKNISLNRYQTEFIINHEFIFEGALLANKLEIVNHYMKRYPKESKKILNKPEFFILIASLGYLEIFNLIVKNSGDDMVSLIKIDHFAAFRAAANYGQIIILRRLQELAPDLIDEMLEACDYECFLGAGGNGLVETMSYILEITSDYIKEKMLLSQLKPVFRQAVNLGYIKVIDKIAELEPDKIRYLVDSRNFEAVGEAVFFKQYLVARRLLDFPICFHNAARELSYYQKEFFLEKLRDVLELLRNQKKRLEDEHKPFDLDGTDQPRAETLKYIVLNLIKLNDPNYSRDIQLLLEIPAVKGLVDKEDASKLTLKMKR